MLSEWERLFRFDAADAESVALLRRLQRKHRKCGLSAAQEWQLLRMEEWMARGRVCLLPALIFAVANQSSAQSALRGGWIIRAVCQRSGDRLLAQWPGFLRHVGWRERPYARFAAGMFALAQEGRPEYFSWMQVVVVQGWSLLWTQIQRAEKIGREEWEVFLSPWEDSEKMRCAMTGVLLFLANLQGKPVEDRDLLWKDLGRLGRFTGELTEASEGASGEIREGADVPGGAGAAAVYAGAGEEALPLFARSIAAEGLPAEAPFQGISQGCPSREEIWVEWLMTQFCNPHRPAYLKEKGRFDSEWLETLFAVMELAGIPKSACENLRVSHGEICRIFRRLPERPSNCQYMSLLLLYVASRELALTSGIAAERLSLP